MTIQPKRTHSPINVVQASTDQHSTSPTSKHPPQNISTNKTRFPFDPMSSSLAKRRYSEQSSSSSITSGDDEGKCASISSTSDSEDSTKSSDTKTPDHGFEIRNTVIPRDEPKIFAELPDPDDDSMSPDAFLHKLVFATCGIDLEPKRAKSLDDFFAKVTDEQVAAYTMAVVTACRNNDLDALTKLHSEEGQTMNCFNRFGESLLTMACRRGFESVVEFLLQQSDVDVRISDDSGRTVLHDACWNPSPQLKICEWIMERDPALWFIADNRGSTPFGYARPEHWGIWRHFLLDNKDSFQALKADDVKSKLSKQN